MDKILFASNNKGKWLELVDDFKMAGIDLLFAPEIPEIGHLNLDENDNTLEKNSEHKARQAFKQTGIPSLGDDSGIFIKELNGAPGVHSRRWFGTAEDDDTRNRKILKLMKDKTNRDVDLSTIFTLVSEDGVIFQKDITNKFYIADNIRGTQGFGYDPILEYPYDSFFFSIYDNRIDMIKKEFSNNDLFDLTTDSSSFLITLTFKKRMTVGELNQNQKNLLNNRGRVAYMIKEETLKNER